MRTQMMYWPRNSGGWEHTAEMTHFGKKMFRGWKKSSLVSEFSCIYCVQIKSYRICELALPKLLVIRVLLMSPRVVWMNELVAQCNLPVPRPIMLKGHVLLMQFIGRDGWPAPLLKNADLTEKVRDRGWIIISDLLLAASVFPNDKGTLMWEEKFCSRDFVFFLS